eukprot:c23687_g2_i1 orf=162-437(-)
MDGRLACGSWMHDRATNAAVQIKFSSLWASSTHYLYQHQPILFTSNFVITGSPLPSKTQAPCTMESLSLLSPLAHLPCKPKICNLRAHLFI